MIVLLPALVLLAAAAPIDVPARWSAQQGDGVWIFTPPDLPSGDFTRLEVYPAEPGRAGAWIGSAWDVVAKGYTAQRQIQAMQDTQFNDSAVAAGILTDGVNTVAYATLLAFGDGKKLLPMLFVGPNKASFDQHLATAVTTARKSMKFPGPDALMAFVARPHPLRPTSVAARRVASPPPGKVERVPDSDWNGGNPQGMFVGSSLLSGKAICLLFLEGGRITRAIPKGGLEVFSWEEHQRQHPGDSGAYTLIDGNLTVRWGDGGIHSGPIKATANGIEFYQKRYSKPATVSVAQLAGSWESARTVGQLTYLQALEIGADGSFQWVRGTGGLVASDRAYRSRPADGRAVASFEGARRGKVRLRGPSAIFTDNDGSVSTHTFHPISGEPFNVFSLGMDTFVRKK